MTSIKSEHDVIHNKINILLAKNQRLVASWPSLQQTYRDQPLDNRSEEDMKREQQEIFALTTDLYACAYLVLLEADKSGLM